jgi:hypothetical protein
VRVQWTGDGDLDLSVEEPLGTVASCDNSQSRGGGVHRHDGYGPDPKNCYEEYVCALGVPGVYVVRVKRIEGTVVGNRAQLTVIRNQGAKNESTQAFVLKLERDAAAVRIYVPDGRRRRLSPARRANERKTSLLERLIPFFSPNGPAREVKWAMLPAAVAPETVSAPPAGNVVQAGGVAAVNTPSLVVPFEPIIEVIPEGTTMSAAAVISRDLRYVRLAVNPSFSSIASVFTFTFVQTR